MPSLPIPCSRCARVNPPGSRFCLQCGQGLPPPAAPPAPAPQKGGQKGGAPRLPARVRLLQFLALVVVLTAGTGLLVPLCAPALPSETRETLMLVPGELRDLCMAPFRAAFPRPAPEQRTRYAGIPVKVDTPVYFQRITPDDHVEVTIPDQKSDSGYLGSYAVAEFLDEWNEPIGKMENAGVQEYSRADRVCRIGPIPPGTVRVRVRLYQPLVELGRESQRRSELRSELDRYRRDRGW